MTQNVLWSRASVCLSADACLDYCTDPDVTWLSGRGCPLVVHCWADMQLMHGLRWYGNTRNVWQSPAVICQAHRIPHACCMWSYLQWGHSISSILRGVVTRRRNVSEYMLVLALCLVMDVFYLPAPRLIYSHTCLYFPSTLSAPFRQY